MFRSLCCMLLGGLLFLSGSAARADEIKRALFVLGIHMSGAEGVALEQSGENPAQKPGSIALIKRTVGDSIPILDALKLPSADLKKILADVDNSSFASLADRLATQRLEIAANASKIINPGAGAYFIMGIHHNGAERISEGAIGFARDKRPGTGALIERQLIRMADGTDTIKVSLKPVLEIQDKLGKGASFADLASDLAKLRLKWQDEIAAQPGFGSTVVVGGGGKAVFSTAGNLTQNDPRDRLRKDMFAKVHVVALKGGQTVIIDLESGNGSAGPGFFDTWLRVEDANGNELAYNDDGGQGLNSRLEFTPKQDGDYRLVVTSYRAGATGAYILTVKTK